jgi:phenylacetic acid degradation protein
MIYEFKGHIPVVHESSYVHPQAAVTGNVTIGKNVYIGPGAAIRADWGEIIIEDGCNVQENAPSICFRAHVGHGAIIHGATLMENCLIGMNAVIMDNAIVGKESIIGALAFVPDSMKVPSRKIAVGNPAKVIKDVSDEMIEWKTMGTELYQSLPRDLHATLKPCEPLRNRTAFKPSASAEYQTWNKNKS